GRRDVLLDRIRHRQGRGEEKVPLDQPHPLTRKICCRGPFAPVALTDTRARGHSTEQRGPGAPPNATARACPAAATEIASAPPQGMRSGKPAGRIGAEHVHEIGRLHIQLTPPSFLLPRQQEPRAVANGGELGTLPPMRDGYQDQVTLTPIRCLSCNR